MCSSNQCSRSCLDPLPASITRTGVRTVYFSFVNAQGKSALANVNGFMPLSTKNHDMLSGDFPECCYHVVGSRNYADSWRERVEAVAQFILQQHAIFFKDREYMIQLLLNPAFFNMAADEHISHPLFFQ